MSTMSKPAAKAGNKNRAKPSFRNTRLGVLPSSIEDLSQLTVDAATKVALTAAAVKLTVEIDAAGTRVFLADQRTGQLIGGPEDLSKLGGIRAFVTRERREASGIEIARIVAEISYRASNKAASSTQGYEQKALESSYGAAVRPLLTTLERVEANRVKLSENTNPTLSQVFRPYLEDMFCRIRNAYYRHIVLLTKGESKKGQLANELFDAGVPEYIHTKLTNQNLVLERSQELARVLFPQDPSKGLVLTVKEWRSTAFLSLQGRIMVRSSELIKRIIRNDAMLRSFCRIDPAIGLSDETNPLVAKLLKAKVHVVPPMRESGYVTNPGSKMRGGWKFPSPSMETPAGSITALGIAFLRIYAANLQTVDLVGDYYHTIAPGQVSRAALSPTNNFYVQWSNSTSPNILWNACVTGNSNDGNLRIATWRWLRLELRLSEKGEVGRTLAVALGLTEDAEAVTVSERVTRAQSPDANGRPMPTITQDVMRFPAIPPLGFDWEAIGGPVGLDDLQQPITAAEAPLVDKYQKDYFPRVKKGKTRSAAGANLTRITPEGKFLVESVAKLSRTLSSRIEIWLRGFSDARLQAAASKLALAQFDELFIADQDGDGSDSSDDESAEGE